MGGFVWGLKKKVQVKELKKRVVEIREKRKKRESKPLLYLFERRVGGWSLREWDDMPLMFNISSIPDWNSV